MIILNNIFFMTLIGSFVINLYLLFENLTKRFFNASWHYTILKLIMIIFLIPFGKLGNILLGNVLHINDLLFHRIDSPVSRFLSGYHQLVIDYAIRNHYLYDGILLIWVSGMIIFLSCQMVCYMRFRYIICKNKITANSQMYEIASLCAHKLGITRDINLYVNEYMNTPMLIGFFSPIILMPGDVLDTDKSEYIMSHELTHYKYKDLFIKFIVLLIRTVHWFNPFVYLFSRKMEKWCEYACDEKNAENLTIEMKKKYGLAILETAAVIPLYGSNYGTPFFLPKQNLKERLFFMLNVKKATKSRLLVSFAVALLFISLGITISYSAELFRGGVPYYNHSGIHQQSGQVYHTTLDLNKLIDN